MRRKWYNLYVTWHRYLKDHGEVSELVHADPEGWLSNLSKSSRPEPIDPEHIRRKKSGSVLVVRYLYDRYISFLNDNVNILKARAERTEPRPGYEQELGRVRRVEKKPLMWCPCKHKRTLQRYMNRFRKGVDCCDDPGCVVVSSGSEERQPVVIRPPFDIGDEIELDQDMKLTPPVEFDSVKKGCLGVVKSIVPYGNQGFHVEMEWESGSRCPLLMPQDKAHKVVVRKPQIPCCLCGSPTIAATNFCYDCRSAFGNEFMHIPFNKDALSIIKWALKWHWKRS
jgi:hypothetical protein